MSMFWRGWHASFNKWITMYLYLPLGGRSNPLAPWVVFGFVAIWHDFDRKLIAWGFLNAFFFMIEIAGGIISQSYGFDSLSPTTKTAVRCFTGGFFVLVLMSVNLIGYAFGVEGFMHAVEVFSKFPDGPLTIAMSFLVVCASVRVMIAKEVEWKSQGKNEPML